MTRRLLVVLVVLLPLYVWHLDRPGFSDTEGMFAEPAREMILERDWVVPRMNGEPFLTKPPLMYWLPALTFASAGPTEFARLWPALAALATVAVTGMLGATLFGDRAGVLAAAILGTSLGFFEEARFLRADMVLVLCVSLSLYCYVLIRRGAGVGAVIGFWTAIAIGLLDKGLLPLLLPGLAIAISETADGSLRPSTLVARLAALRLPMGLGIIAAIAGPWHLLTGLRVPGFWWDYLVNQHLLFFFDAKLPRDSIPDTLGFFWSMFFVRTLPWSLFLPAAVVHVWRAPPDTLWDPRARPLVVGWLLVVLLFFSLASSRLEHYSLPALPAAALLLGFLFDRRQGVSLPWLVIPPLVVALLALALVREDLTPLVVAGEPALAQYHLSDLARVTTAILAFGFLTMTVLLALRRATLGVGAGCLMAIGLMVCIQLAHERVEALFSWRPFGTAIAQTAPPNARVFFRASDEYQLCGGLEFYSGRRLDLLRPPGWVPPTFLVGHMAALFATRASFEHEWSRGPAFFVSDDVDTVAELVPGPYALLARAGARVLLRTPVPLPSLAADVRQHTPGLGAP